MDKHEYDTLPRIAFFRQGTEWGPLFKVWEIDGKQLKPAMDEELAASHVEAELETWIVNHPELLGEKLLIIDRQREIPNVGRLDLLGINADGTLVVIELKRA